MKPILLCATLVATAATLSAQASPPETASATIAGKTISIKYSAPSVRGRTIFGDGGLVMKDPHAPVWRAGANAATALHTDGDLDIGGLSVPAGDYTLFVNVKDPNQWELIVSKQTGEWGLAYNAANDLGHTKMNMSKPPALVEVLKYTITPTSGKKGKIELAWENHLASVPVTVK
ncbi:MAG TPA: DUF2911 domain-containing protein [Bryobacteraceae bacterium]|jgi:hypothetical protein